MDAEVTERPPIIRERKQRSDKGRKRGTKNNQASTDSKAVCLGLISTGLDAIYRTIAITEGKHWILKDDENAQLSIATHNVLEQLPGDLYEEILRYSEKLGPCVALVWTAYLITKPRIDESRRINSVKKENIRTGGNIFSGEFRNNKGERYSSSPSANYSSDGNGVTKEVV